MGEYGADTARSSLVSYGKRFEGQLDYSRKNARNILKGTADCSSFVHDCYKNVLGMEIGGYTGAQIENGVEVDTSTRSSRVPAVSRLKKGDLLFYRSKSSNGYPRGVGHVEMYIGDGLTLGHGGGSTGTAKGPSVHNAATYRTQQSAGNYYICARRYINDGDTFDIKSEYVVSTSGDSGDAEYYGANSNSADALPIVVWQQRADRTASTVLNGYTVPDEAQREGLCVFVNQTDVTGYCGNIRLNETLDGFVRVMTFTVAKRADNEYLRELMSDVYIGDAVSVTHGGREIYRGIVTSVNDGDLYETQVQAQDMGFFLKTEETYQFTELSAGEALRSVFSDLDIAVKEISGADAAVTQIYFDRAVSDVISSILEICGGVWAAYAAPEGFVIKRAGEDEINPVFTLAENIPPVDAFLTAHDAAHTQSAEDMYNAVKAVTASDNLYEELLMKYDSEAISKYGFLQKLIQADTSKDDVNSMATETLSELDREKETFTVSVFSDKDIRKGAKVRYGTRYYYVAAVTTEFLDDGKHFDVEMELTGM